MPKYQVDADPQPYIIETPYQLTPEQQSGESMQQYLSSPPLGWKVYPQGGSETSLGKLKAPLPTASQTPPLPPERTWAQTFFGDDPVRGLTMTAGGALGGSLGMTGSPLVAVPAAGAGAMGAGALYDVLHGTTRELPAEIQQSLSDLIGGMYGEMGGQAMIPAVRWLAQRLHLYSPLSKSAQLINQASERLGLKDVLFPSQIPNAPDVSPGLRMTEELPQATGFSSGPIEAFSKQGLKRARDVARGFTEEVGTPLPVPPTLRTAAAGKAVRAGVQQAMEEGTTAGEQAAQDLTQRMSLPNIPTADPTLTGLAAREAIGQTVGTQERAAGEEVRNLAQSVGQQLDASAQGLAAKRGLKGALSAWGKAKGPLFEAVEQTFGDAPVVEPSRLHEVSQALLQEAGATASPLPRVTPFLGRVGVPQETGMPQDILQLTEQSQSTDQPRFLMALKDAMRRDASMAPVAQALDQSEEGGLNKIPFWAARRIQSWLGNSSNFREPVGSISQNKARALYGAISDDINTFFKTPEAASQLPAHQEALQFYKTGYNLFQEGMNKAIINGKIAPAEVLDRIFAPTPKALEGRLDFKTAVPDDTWSNSVATWLSDLYERSMRGQGSDRHFVPREFLKLLEPYQREAGSLESILTPTQQTTLLSMAQDFAKADRTPIYQLGRLVNQGDIQPENVVPRIMAPGSQHVYAQQAYRNVVSPQLWQETQQSLAQKVFESSFVEKEGERVFSLERYANNWAKYDRPLSKTPGTQLDFVLGPHPAETDPQVIAQAQSTIGELKDLIGRMGKVKSTSPEKLGTLLTRNEANPADVIEKGFQSAETTGWLRDSVTPDLWDAARQAKLEDLYQQSFKDTSHGTYFLPTAMAKSLKDLDKRGILESLMNPHPSVTDQTAIMTGQDLYRTAKDMIDIYEKMSPHERMVLPETSGSRWYQHHTIFRLAHLATALASGLALGRLETPLIGASTGVGMLAGIPLAMRQLGKFMVNPGHRTLLTEGLTGKYSGPALGFASRVLGQRLAPDLTGMPDLPSAKPMPEVQQSIAPSSIPAPQTPSVTPSQEPPQRSMNPMQQQYADALRTIPQELANEAWQEISQSGNQQAIQAYINAYQERFGARPQ